MGWTRGTPEVDSPTLSTGSVFRRWEMGSKAAIRIRRAYVPDGDGNRIVATGAKIRASLK